MQALDEIIEGIMSKAEQLVRKLKELSIENEKLQLENRQLKQDLRTNREVDLFSNNAQNVKSSSETQIEIAKMKQELNQCIKEVKSCLELIDDESDV